MVAIKAHHCRHMPSLSVERLVESPERAVAFAVQRSERKALRVAESQAAKVGAVGRWS